MSRTGADFFVEALSEYGVKYLFGNPGTTEVPIMSSLEDSAVQYILGLHEDIAVGMASGYACTNRQRGDDLPVGVVNLHVAPGMAHGLGNLYGASVSNAPLVVTAGAHGTDHQHEEPILHGDLKEMTDQFTKWSAEVKNVKALPTMIRRAFKVALTPPMGPVFLGLPIDVLTASTDADVDPLDSIPSVGRGDSREIARAVDAFVDAEEPVVIVGDGVAWSGESAIDSLVDLVEASGARVHSEILSTEINFPMSHDLWVSHTPESFDTARKLHDTDTVIQIGCSTHTPSLAHDEPLVDPASKRVHIGADSWHLGKNMSADISVVGDLATVIEELARRVDGRVSAEELDRRRSNVAERKEWARKNVHVNEGGSKENEITKAALIRSLENATSDPYIVDESVTTRYVLLSEWDLEPGELFGNKSGGLGYGLPASIGAAIAESDREDGKETIGLIGDGSYLYYPQSIYTATKYDLDLTVVVSNNKSYQILKDNMVKIMGGNRTDHGFIAMDFDTDIDIAMNAASLGADATSIAEAEELDSEISDAIDSSGPSVLDVQVVD
jgi:benzoylformate decarboxylase